ILVGHAAAVPVGSVGSVAAVEPDATDLLPGRVVPAATTPLFVSTTVDPVTPKRERMPRNRWGRGQRPPRPKRGLPARWPIIPIGTGLACWVVSMSRLQLDAIGTYGLLSALPVLFYVGLGVVVIGMTVALMRGARMPVVFLHAVLFIGMVHATPAIVYGTL